MNLEKEEKQIVWFRPQSSIIYPNPYPLYEFSVTKESTEPEIQYQFRIQFLQTFWRDSIRKEDYVEWIQMSKMVRNSVFLQCEYESGIQKKIDQYLYPIEKKSSKK